MKKIKVFLGGYVNSQNAQNNNCRSLSEHLDKEKFEVWTMITWHGYPKNNDFVRTPEVHYIYDTLSPWTEKLHLPFWLFAWMAYAIGIIKCDVAFLPKGEYVKFCHFVARISGCKLFTTMEGILSEGNLAKVKHPQKYLDHFRSFEPRLYSITKHIVDRESKNHDFHFQPQVLYLGVETDIFLHQNKEPQGLHNIVFIGNNLDTKNAKDVIAMASDFPMIQFHLVGSGDTINNVKITDYTRQKSVTNVVHHGTLNHTMLSKMLQGMDLMFFPSRSEGFPKVMLETACAGVPTLCYGDYGADEWITSGKNGFVVNTYEEARAVIQDLVDHPAKLQPLSDAAVELGRSFDWKVLVKTWEEEIEQMAKER